MSGLPGYCDAKTAAHERCQRVMRNFYLHTVELEADMRGEIDFVSKFANKVDIEAMEAAYSCISDASNEILDYLDDKAEIRRRNSFDWKLPTYSEEADVLSSFECDEAA